MNRTKLKNFAPQARRDFIQAMADRAAYYSLTATKIEPVVERGDVAVIAGREHPRAVAKKRRLLEDRIQRHGFEQTMEAMAYTWFNRLVAIRFMELHGYLEHGYRVLSHPEGKPTPEILEHAEHVDLPGLKKDVVIDLKLAGNKESELFRLLLTAQCNALHAAMPFLFERIDDETELLLPDNLLNSDSLIRKLVGEIEEEDWQQVEIIGWLYQFYISEKKDEVIGKVVASEDIPAATQLFTPNWIVKYLVQNTLGRQWLATYPQSALRQQMEYYIEPAEQTPEVQVQLKAITPTSLNPEELTLLDPACGSGHILVEAYDLFKAIYQERGYRAKDIPALILQKNLFGLEIDDRAAQLAAFALMMKARADDRRIFDSEVKPNILAFEESRGMNAADITHALNSPINKEELPPSEYLIEEIEEAKTPLFSKKILAERGYVSQSDIGSLLALFENAKTFGSLIQVPQKLAAKLPEIEKRLNDVLKHGDLTHASAHVLKPLLGQARLLVRQYDAVVANPPYMGSKGMNPSLKEYAKANFPDNKSDLFAIFIERGFGWCKELGLNGMVTMQSWMFLSSYDTMRDALLKKKTILCMVHMGNGVMGIAFGTAATVMLNRHVESYSGEFSFCDNDDLGDDNTPKQFPAVNQRLKTVKPDEFRRIPGTPIAYWASQRVRDIFATAVSIGSIGQTKQGLATGANNLFLRYWFEVSFNAIKSTSRNRQDARASGLKWFPCNKGGSFRRWYGNNDYVVNWKNDGEDIKNDKLDRLRRGLILASNSVPKNQESYFKEGITWSAISSGILSMRYSPASHMFETKGAMYFSDDSIGLKYVLALANSALANTFLSILSPTMDFHEGPFLKLPLILNDAEKVAHFADECVALSRQDWDRNETSWEFARCPLLDERSDRQLEDSFSNWMTQCSERRFEILNKEEAINRLLIKAYGLQGELSPEVPDDQITLYRPDREEDIKRLLSYAIGCIMGRYSLDKPGLIYAHSGNQGFDPSQYKTLQADDDGIIPLLETDWGIRDDATNRIVEFVGVAWPKEHLEENLKFIADSPGPNNSEQPRETIRRYLATGFYKHHLSMYKKRPIYWLFSSGKQRAFQCLVYMHRYHEGTLARMRTEYVIPLQGQIAARIEQLEGDKTKATSTSHRKKLQQEQDNLKKQQTELKTFEEKLKHAADQKINLDLDDGVKVNYAKFGDLLAESKAITGGKEEE